MGGIEDLKLGFHNVWKHHYTPGMHEPTTVGDLLINKSIYDKLDDDLKEIIKNAAQATFFRWWVGWQRQNALAYKEMVEKHGVQVHRTPQDILDNFLTTYDEIVAEKIESDPFIKKVVESQRAYAGLVVPYRRSTWPSYEYAGDLEPGAVSRGGLELLRRRVRPPRHRDDDHRHVVGVAGVADGDDHHFDGGDLSSGMAA